MKHSANRKSWFQAGVWALAAIIALSGCTLKTGTAQERDSRAAAGSGDIVVGVGWPFADRNEWFLEGVTMAVDEINTGGGLLGRKIRIVKGDDKQSITDGLSVAQSFADNPDMIAVIGHRSSVVSLPTSEIYNEAGLVMINPLSTNPQLTQKGFDKLFRIIPNDREIASQMGSFSARKGYKRIVIYYVNDNYGRGLANSFEDYAEAHGMTIVDRITYFGDTTELANQIKKWRALDCDAIFVADTVPKAAEFIARVRGAGAEVPILGGDGLDSNRLTEIAGQAAEGVIVASIFNPNDKRPEVSMFVSKFENKHKVLPNKLAAQGYDAVHLLSTAILKAGTTRPVKISEALHTLKDWPGVTGRHTFDKNGDVVDKQVVKKQVRNGKFEYIND